MKIKTFDELVACAREFNEPELLDAVEEYVDDVEGGCFFLLGVVDSRVDRCAIDHVSAAKHYARLGVSKEEACACRQDYAINKN
jgi:hypothetical protein